MCKDIEILQLVPFFDRPCIMGGDSVPEGSLIMDITNFQSLDELAEVAADKKQWEELVDNLE